MKKNTEALKIPTPSPTEIQTYLNLWDSLDNYRTQESSLRKLFTHTYPNNTEMDDILIKVCSLNDFYSTNILKPYNVAKHILTLQIDQRLAGSDETLVKDIATGHGVGNKELNFYSFATKYCSHHRPTEYPIYDSFVEKMLRYFKNKNSSFFFEDTDLKDYSKYKGILRNFRVIYGLENYTLKDIDKYLWQVGKRYFPKKYKKKIKPTV